MLTTGIHNQVNEWRNRHSGTIFDIEVTPDQVDRPISSLRCNTSTAPDGIYAKHFMYGNSEVLCKHLASIFTVMLQYRVIPGIF